MTYHYPQDIYTEPTVSSDTLANLGPLAPLAGSWEGTFGMDTNPKADGPEHDAYIERIQMQPIDAQANGPQLFYGLRYHIHIVQPDEVETFHDQVGYWLWEPATGNLIQTLTIPRGQVVMATGQVAPDAKTFTVKAVRGSTVNGICSNPFLEQSFRTESYTSTITIHDDGTWSYEQTTMLIVPDYKEPFPHTDHNTLHRIGEPVLNPTAQAEK
ncbi:MAG: heme-binding beta-barrel domain-containing protein [Neisseria sp.]|uniref:FABP family protein n=1 Tax=Neisseria sp. TaxID=192066 RepID=UPI0026DD3D04|nr:heme-binding beta-barrel domain-containing protein [Neisseria sp.]MDO4640554.1 heme-binding beta-barrel domain-containing protein [Neisseria sp.]